MAPIWAGPGFLNNNRDRMYRNISYPDFFFVGSAGEHWRRDGCTVGAAPAQADFQAGRISLHQTGRLHNRVLH